METFGRILARVVGRPVKDETQAPGNYDIDLKYAPYARENSDSPLPSIFTSLKEQLGLQLKSSKVAVAVLVVDHVNEMPTEN